LLFFPFWVLLRLPPCWDGAAGIAATDDFEASNSAFNLVASAWLSVISFSIVSFGLGDGDDGDDEKREKKEFIILYNKKKQFKNLVDYLNNVAYFDCRKDWCY
jgi:hypothetical protein